MSVPPEPNQHIEELLKAYAEQRRKDAGESLQMSERTRNLLLRAAVRASVARQAAQQTPSWRDRLLSHWPRFAVGAGVAAAVVVVAVIMQPGEKKPRSIAELAELEPKATPIATIAPAPEPKPTAAQVASQRPAPTAAPAERRKPSPAKTKTPAAEVVTAADAIRALEARKKEAAPAPAAEESGAKPGVAETKIAAAPVKKAVSDTAKPKAAKPAEVAAVPTVRLADADKKVGKEMLEREQRESATAGVKLAVKDAPRPPAPTAPAPVAAPAPTAKKQPLGATSFGAKKAQTAAAPAMPPAPTVSAAAGPEAASNIAAANSRLAFQYVPSQVAQQVRGRQMRFTQIALKRDAVSGQQAQAAQQQVMSSFQLEQDGDRIVIQDADGSTYKGQVQAAPAAQPEKHVAGRLVKAAKPMPETDSRVAGQQVFFTLSGTNRSLNQRVEFNGNLTLNQPWQRADTAPAREIGVMGAPSAATRAEPTAPTVLRLQSPRMPSRVQGRARLSDGSELDINAISVGP